MWVKWVFSPLPCITRVDRKVLRKPSQARRDRLQGISEPTYEKVLYSNYSYISLIWMQQQKRSSYIR